MWKRAPRTRAEAMAAADRARVKGRLVAAATVYRQVLAEHGPDPRVHGKLAPVLVQLDDLAGAVASFRGAAQGYLGAGFSDRALAVYMQARAAVPLECEFHREAARIYLVRERRADAANVLAEGGRVLGASRREVAMAMLRDALALQPTHVEATLALAPLLRKVGRSTDARELLDRIEPNLRGRELRRARWMMFRIAPGFRTASRWLSVCLRRSSRSCEGDSPPAATSATHQEAPPATGEDTPEIRTDASR